MNENDLDFTLAESHAFPLPRDFDTQAWLDRLHLDERTTLPVQGDARRSRGSSGKRFLERRTQKALRPGQELTPEEQRTGEIENKIAELHKKQQSDVFNNAHKLMKQTQELLSSEATPQEQLVEIKSKIKHSQEEVLCEAAQTVSAQSLHPEALKRVSDEWRSQHLELAENDSEEMWMKYLLSLNRYFFATRSAMAHGVKNAREYWNTLLGKNSEEVIRHQGHVKLLQKNTVRKRIDQLVRKLEQQKNQPEYDRIESIVQQRLSSLVDVFSQRLTLERETNQLVNTLVDIQVFVNSVKNVYSYLQSFERSSESHIDIDTLPEMQRAAQRIAEIMKGRGITLPHESHSISYLLPVWYSEENQTKLRDGENYQDEKYFRDFIQEEVVDQTLEEALLKIATPSHSQQELVVNQFTLTVLLKVYENFPPDKSYQGKIDRVKNLLDWLQETVSPEVTEEMRPHLPNLMPKKSHIKGYLNLLDHYAQLDDFFQQNPELKKVVINLRQGEQYHDKWIEQYNKLQEQVDQIDSRLQPTSPEPTAKRHESP